MMRSLSGAEPSPPPSPRGRGSIARAPSSRGTGSIARDLRALVTTSEVVDAPSELRTFAYDASFFTQLQPRDPDCAVIARSRDDVAAVVRYAHEHAIPLIPRGAASGQAGGSVALGGGIVLSVHAMDRVLEVDTAN